MDTSLHLGNAFWPVVLTVLFLLFAFAVVSVGVIVWMCRKPADPRTAIQCEIAKAIAIGEGAEKWAAAGKKADALIAEVAPDLVPKATK